MAWTGGRPPSAPVAAWGPQTIAALEQRVGAKLMGMVVPFETATDAATMTFLSTTTMWGTPVDITLSTIALECSYPPATCTQPAVMARLVRAMTRMQRR